MKNIDYKDLLTGHVKDQLDANVLYKRWENSRVHARHRSSRSYLLDDTQTQKERRATSIEVQPQRDS